MTSARCPRCGNRAEPDRDLSQFRCFDCETSFMEEWPPLELAAGSAGLRLGEIRALRWDDWERGVKKMTVHQAFWKQVLGPTKGWNLRTVPLTSRYALVNRPD